MKIIKAEHVEKFIIQLTFDDNAVKRIDFEPFFRKNKHPQWNKYTKIENFKNFKIEYGNIIWGKDWDLIFPIASLYCNKIS